MAEPNTEPGMPTAIKVKTLDHTVMKEKSFYLPWNSKTYHSLKKKPHKTKQQKSSRMHLAH